MNFNNTKPLFSPDLLDTSHLARHDQKSIDRSVRVKIVAAAYRQTPLALLAVVVNTIFLALVESNVVNHTWIALWIMMQILVILGRYLTYYFYNKSGKNQASPKWERWFVLNIVFSAIVWGLASLVFFLTPQIAYHSFLAFALAGMCAGAIVSISYVLRAFNLYLMFILMPLVSILLLQESSLHHFMGLLSIIFWIIITVTARRYHQHIYQAFESKILHTKAIDALALSDENLKHQAYFDALTDIPNRILLKDRIKQALVRYQRHGNIVAVLFLDLDHFKSVNDSMGHHIGDALLIETAKRLVGTCRADDTVARLGGDEFVILLSELGGEIHTAASNAEGIAEKVHEALSQPFDIGLNEPIVVTSSIGIALATRNDQNADDLLKFADTAMYQAKKEGRNTTRFYQEQMDQWIKNRLSMENSLRNALKNNELELFYQPVIAIESKKIIGAEALLRWNHPQKGLVMPDEIIEIAEESGLIVPIGDWVMREACLQFVEWKKNHPKNIDISRIAINVSVIQFRQKDFVDKVIHIVANSHIDPRMLEIELTESLIIDEFDSIIETMNCLRGFGIRLSMDDFGTGYSSLAYLKKLPFTTLKIDRSFIRDIMSDSDDAALVETILSMASIFKLDVIAEGVETVEQFEFLQRHDCQYFQGYLCSKPVDVTTFEALLDADMYACKSERF